MKRLYREMIDRFEAGGRELPDAVAGLTPEDALTRPGADKWSAREEIIHLADSDAIAIDRMKRVIAEENPTLLRADEQAYVDHLHYDLQDLDDAVLLFCVNRRQFARVLRQLEDCQFERVGIHNSELGRITLAELIENYWEHLDIHLQRVKQIRASLNSAR